MQPKQATDPPGCNYFGHFLPPGHKYFFSPSCPFPPSLGSRVYFCACQKNGSVQLSTYSILCWSALKCWSIVLFTWRHYRLHSTLCANNQLAKWTLISRHELPQAILSFERSMSRVSQVHCLLERFWICNPVDVMLQWFQNTQWLESR